MTGSGLSDVLLEEELIGSCSGHKVLSLKHCERAMHCRRMLLESLERILLDKFLEQENEDVIFASRSEGTRSKISILIYSQTKYTMVDPMSDEGFITYMKSILNLRRVSEIECLGKLLSSGYLTWTISGSCRPLSEL